MTISVAFNFPLLGIMSRLICSFLAGMETNLLKEGEKNMFC